MLAGLRGRADCARVRLGLWLMTAGLRLVGVRCDEEPVDDSEDDDEPVPAQDPLTAEAAAMVVGPKPPPARPPPPPPLKGSAKERYHARSRRAVH